MPAVPKQYNFPFTYIIINLCDEEEAYLEIKKWGWGEGGTHKTPSMYGHNHT